MIKVTDLVRDFGRRRAVDDISFEVEKGTVLGFLGPNGAGKTTTIRMIAGFLSPTAGKVEVGGIDVANNPVKAQKLIGYMPERAPLYEGMSVTGFLQFVAEIRGLKGSQQKERVEHVIERCFLGPVRNQSIDTLSKGYRQRTCLAQSFLHDPQVLLLDEPTEGLDPNQKQVIRDMIREMASEKVIMLSTHVLEEVEAICTRAIIISGGKLVADDTPAGLKKRSHMYNAVTVEVNGDAAKAVSDLPNVDTVTQLDDGRLRIEPKEGASIAAEVISAIQKDGLNLIDLKVDEGNLDEVFGQITITEDTKVEAAQ